MGHEYRRVLRLGIFKVSSSGFTEALQVEAVILLGVEAGLAIVAPLNDVLGDRR